MEREFANCSFLDTWGQYVWLAMALTAIVALVIVAIALRSRRPPNPRQQQEWTVVDENGWEQLPPGR